MCPNCKIFHSKCNAGCCGPVPINGAVYRANIPRLQRPVEKVMEMGSEVVPITADLTCAFLSKELQCMIYEERPDVCKKFGDESHSLMTCAYQKADGNPRTKKETKKILKLSHEKITPFL